MPGLFKNRMFSTSLVLGVLVSMTMFGSLMFLPVYVQGVVGLNAQDSGWVMAPMMISFIVGSIISGQIMSRPGRYRTLAWISGAVIIPVGQRPLGSFSLSAHGTSGDIRRQ